MSNTQQISRDEATEGFVFATTGESYTILARRAARTMRQVMPNCLIDLFTDQKIEDDVFDQIHRLDHSWYRPKMQALRESRFDRSVVLDADILVLADISEIFRVLDQCDLAGVQGVARNPGMLTSTHDVPFCVPPINSGVLAIKASDKMRSFSHEWEKRFRESGLTIDQPALRELIYLDKDIRFMALGAEYNVIKLKSLKTWDPLNGSPKVLHVRKLHKNEPGDPLEPFSLSEVLDPPMVKKIQNLKRKDWTLWGCEPTEVRSLKAKKRGARKKAKKAAARKKAKKSS